MKMTEIGMARLGWVLWEGADGEPEVGGVLSCDKNFTLCSTLDPFYSHLLAVFAISLSLSLSLCVCMCGILSPSLTLTLLHHSHLSPVPSFQPVHSLFSIWPNILVGGFLCWYKVNSGGTFFVLLQFHGATKTGWIWTTLYIPNKRLDVYPDIQQSKAMWTSGAGATTTVKKCQVWFT